MTEKAEFILHASRAFFASAWADAAADANSEAASGVEIMNAMPDDIDPSAVHAAETLLMDLERKNGKDLDTLMGMIERDGDGDRPNTVEMFGHYCAMQAMGHGVGLYDAFGQDMHAAIQVPYVEFGSHSLERDYFPA